MSIDPFPKLGYGAILRVSGSPLNLVPGQVVQTARDARLDALRGVFLVLMVGVHLPLPCSDWFHDPFGVVGAADGFVFLSACLAGRVYGRTDGAEGWARSERRIWQRVGLIYRLHLLVVLPVVLLAWVLAGWVPVLAGHFVEFLAHPVGGLFLLPLLLHQPPLFDILPLYIILLAFTPWLLTTARRLGWGPLLAGSCGIWLLVQFKLDAPLFADPARWLPVRWGSFDPFAWQLIWVVGVALGETSRRRALGEPLRRAWIFGPALAIVAFGLIKRHGLWPHVWWNDDLYLWMDKWTLGPLRLLNFFAWVTVLVAWNPRVPVSWFGTLALFGRHSLAVFAMHLPLAVGVEVWFQLAPPAIWAQNLIGLAVLTGLWFWARWRDGRANAQRQLKSAAEPELQPVELPHQRRKLERNCCRAR